MGGLTLYGRWTWALGINACESMISADINRPAAIHWDLVALHPGCAIRARGWGCNGSLTFLALLHCCLHNDCGLLAGFSKLMAAYATVDKGFCEKGHHKNAAGQGERGPLLKRQGVRGAGMAATAPLSSHAACIWPSNAGPWVALAAREFRLRNSTRMDRPRSSKIRCRCASVLHIRTSNVRNQGTPVGLGYCCPARLVGWSVGLGGVYEAEYWRLSAHSWEAT